MAAVMNDLTVLILTNNEAPNIGRTLDKLRWARRVVVVDSFSTDSTCDIIRTYSNTEVRQRHFDNHANQWNYGLMLVESEWVLSLDADYQVTDSLVSELKALSPDEATDAYYVRFRYCVEGRPLRGTLYPPRAVLFRRSRCSYEQNGHTQLLRIHGKHLCLKSFIYHDDRKPLSVWLTAQNRYALLEAQHLLTDSRSELNIADRVRRWMVPAPPLIFFYTLFVKGLVLNGWRGWYYALQRTLAEILLSLRLLEARLGGN